jgi:hypothetical protein
MRCSLGSCKSGISSLPIDARFAVIFVSVALLVAGGALLFRGAAKKLISQGAAAVGWTLLLLAISLLAFIPVFNGCTKSMCHIDLGLYYLKLIRWIQTFPIVPSFKRVWMNCFGIQTYDSPLPSSWKPRPFLALLNPDKGIAGGFKYARPPQSSP